MLEPWSAEQLNPNSYNFRLGDRLLHAADPSGLRSPAVELRIPEEGFVLEPGNLYLGVTHERIGSSVHVTTLLGRSSLGRLGLFLNATADLGHLGTCSRWTLELSVVQPLRVYPRMEIGQVSFWTVSGAPTAYAGSYQADTEPVTCRDADLARSAA